MSAGKIIAYVAAALLLVFGALFILGAFSPEGQAGWIVIGLILVGMAFVLIWLASRRGRAGAEGAEIVQRIELSGDINLEKLTCRNCGGALSADNIKMVAGAPVVTCPYCSTSYQLAEEPKW
jgi:type VI protein secretion system component VasK